MSTIKVGSQLGAVSDYDVITIGGEQYSANQLLDKNIVAKSDALLYPSLYNDTGKFLVKKGQSIGKVISWLNPISKNNPTGKVVLQFDRNPNQIKNGIVAPQYFWLKDDKAVSTEALATQGTKTVDQEIKVEADKKELEESPVLYYIKKVGKPILYWSVGLYIGGIVLKELFSIGKESIRKKAGLSGVKRKKVRKSKRRK
jgi:hypothetical protein